MTDQPSTATANAAATIRMQGKPAETKKQLRADIGGKWGKFSQQGLTDLKDSDDLVAQLVAKYDFEKGRCDARRRRPRQRSRLLILQPEDGPARVSASGPR